MVGVELRVIVPLPESVPSPLFVELPPLMVQSYTVSALAGAAASDIVTTAVSAAAPRNAGENLIFNPSVLCCTDNLCDAVYGVNIPI
jgi:hypothetical protein